MPAWYLVTLEMLKVELEVEGESCTLITLVPATIIILHLRRVGTNNSTALGMNIEHTFATMHINQNGRIALCTCRDI